MHPSTTYTASLNVRLHQLQITNILNMNNHLKENTPVSITKSYVSGNNRNLSYEKHAVWINTDNRENSEYLVGGTYSYRRPFKGISNLTACQLNNLLPNYPGVRAV